MNRRAHIIIRSLSALCLMLLCIVPLSISEAYADTMQPLEPADVCTDGPQFTTDIPPGEIGVFSNVAQQVTGMTSSLSQTMFESIQGDSGFQSAIGAALVLYVAIFGLFFISGLTRASAHDLVIRYIKVAVIAVLANPNAWSFFGGYLSNFFNDATDDFMAKVALITIGGSQISGEDLFPMAMIDAAIAKIISINMGVHLLALLMNLPFGLFYLVLLGVALWAFLGLLFTGIWVYLTSIVMRGLLIGIAPIFLGCLLFTKTKHLFDGWLNQLISTCLQPILLFTFLSFFILIIITGPNNLIDQILNQPVCWSAASESLQGSPFNVHFWRFTIPKSDTIDPGTASFDPYGGEWGWTGPPPIQFIPLLTFFILAELGRRFGQMVLMIARELSNSSVDVSDMQNVLGGLLPTSNIGGTPVSGKAAAEAGALKKSIEKDGVAQTFVKNTSNSIINSLRGKQ